MLLSTLVPSPNISTTRRDFHSTRKLHKVGRKQSVTMAGDKMQERFGDFTNPESDDAAYGSAEEPLFGSRYTSHDMPKYE